MSAKISEFKYMIYSTYADNILCDYFIPCYHYYCNNCDKHSNRIICDTCKNECELKSYEYAFFNNQLYQERINYKTYEPFYITVIDNYKSKISYGDKSNNTLTYRSITKQLYKKCRITFKDEHIVIVNDNDNVINNETEKSNELKQEEMSAKIEEIIKLNPKPPVPKPKSIEPTDSRRKLYNKINEKLKTLDINRNIKIVKRFLNNKDYEHLREAFTKFCDGFIYKHIYYIDKMFKECDLFKITTDLYDSLMNSINDTDVKSFVEVSYMFIHAYVLACSNLPKVRDLITKNQKIDKTIMNEFFTDEELKFIMDTKLNYENKFEVFEQDTATAKLNTSKIVDKLIYIKLFSFDVLGVIDE